MDSVVLGADLASSSGSCLVPRVGGITIDGNGHTITAAGFAVDVTDLSDITIRDVVSPQGIQIYGGGANRNVVEGCDVQSIGVYMGDDNVIRNSKTTVMKVAGLYDDPPLRAVVTGNSIVGPDTVLLHVSPGGDGECVESDAVIEGNYIEGTASDPSAPDQVLVYLRCGTHNTLTGNTLRSTGVGNARGFYLRDEADDNLIGDNDVWIRRTDRGAFHISSGNVDKHHPRGNLVQRNRFRVDSGRSFWIQAYDTRDNSFIDNLFVGNGPEAGRVKGGTNDVFDHNTFVNAEPGNLLVLESFQPPGNVYTNNIFVNSGPSLYALSGTYDFGGYHGDHNVFFNRVGSAIFNGAWTFPQWQQQSAQDTDSIEANPEFADEAGGDFNLKSDSPAATSSSNGGPSGAYPVGP